MFNGMFGCSMGCSDGPLPQAISIACVSARLLDNTLEGSKLYPVSGGT